MTGTDLTAQGVVDRIRADVEQRGFVWHEPTVDTFKAGPTDRAVRRIATSWMATSEIVDRAAAWGADLLITHEPTFWNHLDERRDPDDAVLADKLGRAADLTIWRFHDHNHSAFPRDPVIGAFYDRLGWTDRTTGNSIHSSTRLDPTPLGDVAAHVAEAFGTEYVRVIGDPQQVVQTVGLGAHTLDTCLDGTPGADLVLIGETREWDTFEYYRDAVALGLAKSLIVVTHAALETWGSAPLADYVAGLVPEAEVRDLRASEPYAVVTGTSKGESAAR